MAVDLKYIEEIRQNIERRSLCPICEEKLDLLEVGFCNHTRCNSCEYDARRYHYWAMFTLGGKDYRTDDCEFEDEKALDAEIDRRREMLGKPPKELE